ncbi:MAG: methyl-accepting chemotaxis protein [Candidatus Omnitrophica bacterium]|nr:methyl-accepting chemotaxis protein [Candidatus Omnitrophota bacterium]
MLSGIRAKLTFLIIGIALVPLVVTNIIVLGQVRSVMQTMRQEEVNKVLEYVSTTFKEFETRAIAYVSIFKNIPDIQDALSYTVTTGDRKQLLAVLKEFSFEDIDALQVIDASGKVLVRVETPLDFGDSKADQEIFKRALQGDIGLGVDSGKRGYAIRAVAPLKSAGETVGVVMLGRFLSDKFARELSIKTFSRIAFFYNNELTGSYFSEEEAAEEIKENFRNKLKQLVREKGIYACEINGESFKFNTFEYSVGKDSAPINVIVGVSDEASQAAQNKMRTILFILLLVVAIIAALTAYFFAQSLTLPLVSLSKQVSQWKGDLNQKIIINSRDETSQVAEAFNQLMDTIKQIVVQVRVTAEEVTHSAESFSTSTQQVSTTTMDFSNTLQEINKGITTQAQRSEETAQLMQHIGNSSKGVAKTVDETAVAAGKSLTQAKQGQVAARETVEIMEKISLIVSETVQTMNVLGVKSQEIGQITEAITTFASQTNLLSLNAAIEAARAGENGRGFAVVAEEVKKLAEGSAKAASRIDTLIIGIQEGISKAVLSIENGYEQVGEGKKVVSKTSQALGEIVNVSDETSKMVLSMSEVINKQIEGIDKVVNTVGEVALIAEKNSMATHSVSSSVEEITASMQQISGAAQKLFELAKTLKKNSEKFGV